MSHRGEISVSACWFLGDDEYHAEEVWAGVDMLAAIDWVARRAGRRIPVVIDNMSPAMALVPGLKARRCKVIQSGAQDMAKACGMVEALVLSSMLTHSVQAAVAAAVAGARKRAIRDAGGWGWDRRDETVNIAPLVAMTLAVLGASMNQKVSRGAMFG